LQVNDITQKSLPKGKPIVCFLFRKCFRAWYFCCHSVY